jgi:hypothetical protein
VHLLYSEYDFVFYLKGMKNLFYLLSYFAITFLWQFSASAQCGTNLLSNPGFESPIQTNIGNNLTGSFTFSGGWTMTGGPFNIVRTNGSNYNGGPNNAQDGTQYADVTAADGTLYQDFTIGNPSTPIAFGGYFSSREQSGYVNWTASIEVLSLPSLSVVASSNTRAFTSADGASSAQEVWHFISGSATLGAGNYRFRVRLANYGNFDAAFVFQNCVLPIRLGFFGGNYADNSVLLNWRTDYHSNFSHFVVERSLNGIIFDPLHEVYLTNSNKYHFRDTDVNSASTFYYRLKMIDKDGSFSYSKVIRIQTEVIRSITVARNPVKDNLIVNGIPRKGTLLLYDHAGRIVIQKAVLDQSISVDVSFLKSGVYYLQFSGSGYLENRKIIKL